MRAEQLRKLMAVGLSPEHLKAVLEIFTERSKEADRQARWRAKQRDNNVTVTRDNNVTSLPYNPSGLSELSQTSFSQEPLSESKKVVVARDQPEVFPSKEDLAWAVEEWNQLAEDMHLPKVKVVTDKRTKALRARLRELGSREAWTEAMWKIAHSPFCRGEKTDWRADFDFVLQPSSMTKLMEGSYDQVQKPQVLRNGNGRDLFRSSSGQLY